MTIPDRAINPADKVSDWRMELEFQASGLWDTDPVTAAIALLNNIEGLGAHQANISTILTELYTNAVDHGLLGLESSMKDSGEGFAAYYEQREQRLASIDEGTIVIGMSILKGDDGRLLTIRVSDSGPGFDFDALKMAGNCCEDYAGRGLGLVCKLCQKLEFHGSGNGVSAHYVLE